MGDVLHFFWIAFRQYWSTWVTGTGLVGFALWLINFYDKRRAEKGRRTLSIRQNLLILFCTFWFLATFSAWHDADKNLEAVKKQREEDTSKLGVCTGDLKAAVERSNLLNTQLHAQQNTINAQQGNMTAQQQAVNRCVVTLAEKTVGEPIKVSVWQEEIPNDPKGPRLTGVALLVNRTVALRGDLECLSPFGMAHWGMMKQPISGGIETDYRTDVLAPNHIHINLGLPLWEPGMPVLLVLTHQGNIGTCSFALQLHSR